jgi:hypothetical protein
MFLTGSTSELAASLLRSGLAVRLPVSGWSMRPLLRAVGVIRVVPSAWPPRLGEVILYRLANGRLVVHRVVRRALDRVWTKGDACVTEDGPVAAAQFLGRVAAIERPVFIPLESACARLAGRLLGWLYPRLVLLRMSLSRRLPEE